MRILVIRLLFWCGCYYAIALFSERSLTQNALVQAPDVPSLDTPLSITLLPSLPSAWGTGAITGAYLRGGITLELQWAKGIAKAKFVTGVSESERPVRVIHDGQLISSFTNSPGLVKEIQFQI